MYMSHKHHHGVPPPDVDTWEGERWDNDTLKRYVQERPGRCIILLDGYVVDATSYMGEHVS